MDHRHGTVAARGRWRALADRTAVRSGAGAAIVAVYALVAVWHVPSARLVPDWSTYGEDATVVLRAMYEHVARAPWVFLVGAWLAPALVAVVVPYAAVRRAYQTVAFACAILWWIAIALVGVDGEWERLVDTLRDEPAMGYMTHDVLLILVVAWLAWPRHTWALLGGPWTAVAFASLDVDGPRDARPSAAACAVVPWLVLVAAAVSIALLLPTVHVFVSASTDTFFLSGYSTDSMIATVLSVGMILVWVIAFHQAAHLARRSASTAPLAAVIFWALGTAAVEIYVGGAIALIVAYAHWTRRRRVLGS